MIQCYYTPGKKQEKRSLDTIKWRKVKSDKFFQKIMLAVMPVKSGLRLYGGLLSKKLSKFLQSSQIFYFQKNMTAIVAVLNRKSVAIAADSAVTVGNTHKVVNCGNKIFTLSKYEPISVMTYNYASFLGTPWEIIIKEYRKQLKDKKKDTVEQYQKDFINYLYLKEFFVNHFNQKNYLEMLLHEFYNVNLSITKNKTGLSVEDPNFYSSFIATINECMRTNANAPKIPGFEHYSIGRFKDYAKEVLLDFYASTLEVPIQNANKDLFVYSFYQFVRCPIVNSNYTGLVFIGYGEKELYPSMVPIKIMGALDGKLRYIVDTSLVCHIRGMPGDRSVASA